MGRLNSSQKNNLPYESLSGGYVRKHQFLPELIILLAGFLALHSRILSLLHLSRFLALQWVWIQFVVLFLFVQDFHLPHDFHVQDDLGDGRNIGNVQHFLPQLLVPK